jgi:cell division septation protein DedD
MARREPAGGSWFGALLALSVLAVAAFFVGALFALAWKEPGLVFAWLRGDTTEIAWSTASDELTPADLPEVAAAPAGAAPEASAAPDPTPAKPVASAAQAAGSAAKPAAPNPPAAAKPPAAKPEPRSVAAASGSHVAVQVGAFAEREAAERLRERLREAGFPAYLAASADSGEHWRVRVGPYASRPEAERIASRLQQGQRLPTWVLDEDAE